MPDYIVSHRYTARRDGQTFGPWEKGDAVQLEQADADWVNRDSEGCLAEAKPKAVKADKDEVADGKTGPNRQHQPAKTRAGR